MTTAHANLVLNMIDVFDEVKISRHSPKIEGWIYEYVNPLGDLRIYWEISSEPQQYDPAYRIAIYQRDLVDNLESPPDEQTCIAWGNLSPWVNDPDVCPIEKNQICNREDLIQLAKTFIVDSLQRDLARKPDTDPVGNLLSVVGD